MMQIVSAIHAFSFWRWLLACANMPASRLCARFTSRIRLVFGLFRPLGSIRPRLGYVLVSLRAYASFLGYFARWAQYARVSAMCSFHFAHTPRFWAISPVGLNTPASRLCARFTSRIRLVFGLFRPLGSIRPRLGYVLVSLRAYASFLGLRCLL